MDLQVQVYSLQSHRTVIPTGKLGHSVVQLCLIFRAVPCIKNQKHPIFNLFLAYVERFDIVPGSGTLHSESTHHRADRATKMLILRRSARSNGERLGDVIPLSGLRAAVDLTPCFQKAADMRLTKETALEYGQTFFLNTDFTKQLYFTLSSQ